MATNYLLEFIQNGNIWRKSSTDLWFDSLAFILNSQMKDIVDMPHESDLTAH